MAPDDGPDPFEDEDSELTYDPVSESPVKRWLLLDGDRLVISAVLAAGVFTAVVALHLGGVLRVRNDQAVVTLLSGLVGGTLPFITIVLAINQLVLSQELGWTDELADRFQGMVSFRRDVEELTGETVSPASPADFLKHVVLATVETGRRLPGSLADDADEDDVADVERFGDALVAEGRPVIDALDDAEFGTFDALTAVLGHHQGDHLHTARVHRLERTDAFADTGPLDELIDLLEALAVARQTFKTLYVQHELAVLSRLLLYVGFPTLVGGGLLVMVYPTLAGDVAIGTLVVVAAVGVTLVFLPFIVLLSYSLRIATIAARTADFGPFVPGD
ncbi:hypothetical protein HWV07_18330 [Natronomonas salina]|uniref:hypothetical protein n=1 Tax=Natronomonas salina TaxID=1710540 RepID=UPI0015B5D773|nr:hypothetical protein [Natronomonas salina]QLD90896.1 hypothetical protein HWV07_18330 [Natronomonas salina]